MAVGTAISASSVALSAAVCTRVSPVNEDPNSMPREDNNARISSPVTGSG